MKITIRQKQPQLNSQGIYRLRTYGDPVMVRELGMDINTLYPPGSGQDSNFQDVMLFNKVEWGFDGVSSRLVIPREEWLNVAKLQINDGFSVSQKMDWLMSPTGSIYFGDNDWDIEPSPQWGTIGIGNNLVKVLDFEYLDNIRAPAEQPSDKRMRRMARLDGFRKEDWSLPMVVLRNIGWKVHRCYCVYKNNVIGDTPVGIVYSPFWYPGDYDYLYPGNKNRIKNFYIPFEWLKSP